MIELTVTLELPWHVWWKATALLEHVVGMNVVPLSGRNLQTVASLCYAFASSIHGRLHGSQTLDAKQVAYWTNYSMSVEDTRELHCALLHALRFRTERSTIHDAIQHNNFHDSLPNSTQRQAMHAWAILATVSKVSLLYPPGIVALASFHLAQTSTRLSHDHKSNVTLEDLERYSDHPIVSTWVIAALLACIHNLSECHPMLYGTETGMVSQLINTLS